MIKFLKKNKQKNIASQAALYFAKSLLGFFELIEKTNDEKGFRSMLKEKFCNLNEMKAKYMEVINELTFCDFDTVLFIFSFFIENCKFIKIT